MVTVNIVFSFWKRIKILFGDPLALHLHDYDKVDLMRKDGDLYINSRSHGSGNIKVKDGN